VRRGRGASGVRSEARGVRSGAAVFPPHAAASGNSPGPVARGGVENQTKTNSGPGRGDSALREFAEDAAPYGAKDFIMVG